MITTLSVFQFSLIVAVVGYLMINMLHMVQVEPAAGRLSQSPLVSVCVPARNEERDIEVCLVSLLQQDYPEFEVIVVDDNSTDATPEILRSLQKEFSKLVYCRESPCLKAGTANRLPCTRPLARLVANCCCSPMPIRCSSRTR